MVLYTCGQKTTGLAMPWTWSSRARDRTEVKKLSGTQEVPMLVVDNGEVVSDSGGISKWAKQNPASAS